MNKKVSGGEGLAAYEPNPIKNDLPAIYDLLRKDIDDRDKFGFEKYGTRLQPFNGRDGLKDAFQEVLDLAVYLRQVIYEDNVLRSVINEAKQAIELGADKRSILLILEKAGDLNDGCESIHSDKTRR